MKIAFLTPSLPFPAHSGGKIKTYKMIEYLQINHSVSVVTLTPEDSPSFKIQCENFCKQLPSLSLRSFVMHRPRTLLNFLISFIYNLPLSVYRNYSMELKRWIDTNCHQFDILLIDHFLMAQYIPKHFKGRVVLHQHNAEYLMWERYAKLQTNPLKKIILLLETWRIKKYELGISLRSHAILVAPNDQESLQQLLPTHSFPFYRTMHLASEELLSKTIPSLKEGKELLYVGTLSWEANWDGLVHFLRHCWSDVLLIHPDAHLTIIGGASELQRKELSTYPSVSVLGYVDDLDCYFDRSQLFLAPLRFGSGIKVKVIEALYRGMATVTTEIGAEGIGAIHLEHLCIASDFEQQSLLINKLLADPKECARLSHQARQFAEQNLTWSSVLKELERSLV